MTRRTSPRLAGYAALAAFGLLGGLALRRPELAAVAAPFALLVVLGILGEQAPEPTVAMHLDDARVVEGDIVCVSLVVGARRPLSRLELAFVVPPGLAALDAPARAFRIGSERRREIDLRLRCDRWGSYVLGDLRLRATGPMALTAWEQRFTLPTPLTVYPAAERLRHLIPPRWTHAFAGVELARAKGDGIEFSDLRAFRSGDPRRAINWRASARRDSLVVNERRPERTTDVVILLDSFAEARTGAAGTLDLGVRATSTLVAHYLDRRDRVGLITLGGILRWLVPAGGAAQRYRLVDALLHTEVELTYAWRGTSTIPSRVLPSRALVIALTPLLDDRMVETLLDLRGRGHDLAVLEVSAVQFVEAGPSELDKLAYRLWLLRRDATHGRLQHAGVGTTRWDGVEPLGVALEEVRAYRRSASLARR